MLASEAAADGKRIEREMNKNELELRKLVLRSENVGAFMNLVQHAISATAVVGSIYIVVGGLERLVQSRPDAISALAVVIEKLQVNSILAYIVAACTTLGYVYERRGKKRAIRKLADLRHGQERQDPYKSSSHLDENGHTPQ